MKRSGSHTAVRSLGAWLLSVLLIAGQAGAAPGSNPCADTLDPLLGCLADWVGEDSPSPYGYAAVVSGAALALGYTPTVGFHLPSGHRLLWPGNLFQAADSSYMPRLPEKLATAQQILLEVVRSGREALLVTPLPVIVYAADTSFGDPWFFVARCRAGAPDTSMWDSGDFKRFWWRWDENPGANSIWPRPDKVQAPRGRRVILRGLRHCVLAARPSTKGSTSTGLAALEAGRQAASPGSPLELARIAAIRLAASAFLLSELELWPPAEREPVKLAAYYLQKSGTAWTDLAARAEDWPLLSLERRDELLAAVSSHETSAAVALDGMVSAAPQ